MNTLCCNRSGHDHSAYRFESGSCSERKQKGEKRMTPSATSNANRANRQGSQFMG
jgi:hypothetical protein